MAGTFSRPLLIAALSRTGLIASDGPQDDVGWVVLLTLGIILCTRHLVYLIATRMLPAPSAPAIHRTVGRSLGAFCLALSTTGSLLGHRSGCIPHCNETVLALTNGGCFRSDIAVTFSIGIVLILLAPSHVGLFVDTMMPVLFLLRIAIVSNLAAEVGSIQPDALAMISYGVWQLAGSAIKSDFFDSVMGRALAKRAADALLFIVLCSVRLPWPATAGHEADMLKAYSISIVLSVTLMEVLSIVRSARRQVRESPVLAVSVRKGLSPILAYSGTLLVGGLPVLVSILFQHLNWQAAINTIGHILHPILVLLHQLSHGLHSALVVKMPHRALLSVAMPSEPAPIDMHNAMMCSSLLTLPLLLVVHRSRKRRSPAESTQPSQPVTAIAPAQPSVPSFESSQPHAKRPATAAQHVQSSEVSVKPAIRPDDGMVGQAEQQSLVQQSGATAERWCQCSSRLWNKSAKLTQSRVPWSHPESFCGSHFLTTIHKFFKRLEELTQLHDGIDVECHLLKPCGYVTCLRLSCLNLVQKPVKEGVSRRMHSIRRDAVKLSSDFTECKVAIHVDGSGWKSSMTYWYSTFSPAELAALGLHSPELAAASTDTTSMGAISLISDPTTLMHSSSSSMPRPMGSPAYSPIPVIEQASVCPPTASTGPITEDNNTANRTCPAGSLGDASIASVHTTNALHGLEMQNAAAAVAPNNRQWLPTEYHHTPMHQLLQSNSFHIADVTTHRAAHPLETSTVPAGVAADDSSSWYNSCSPDSTSSFDSVPCTCGFSNSHAHMCTTTPCMTLQQPRQIMTDADWLSVVQEREPFTVQDLPDVTSASCSDLSDQCCDDLLSDQCRDAQTVGDERIGDIGHLFDEWCTTCHAGDDGSWDSKPSWDSFLDTFGETVENASSG